MGPNRTAQKTGRTCKCQLAAAGQQTQLLLAQRPVSISHPLHFLKLICISKPIIFDDLTYVI